MGIFSGIKDMVDMVKAAPDMIDSAHEMAAQGQQLQAAYAATPVAPVAQPDAANLEPISGVDLESYVRVSKGIAAHGYDASKLVVVAASLGIPADNWAAAQSGWAARIQADRGVGARFNQLYSAV